MNDSHLIYGLVSPMHHKKGEYSTRRYFEREHIYITFITVHYYNCSVLILVIGDSLLLCLIYKLNYIIGVHLEEKHLIYGVRYH